MGIHWRRNRRWWICRDESPCRPLSVELHPSKTM
jgi:hypothetical protein